MPEPFAETLATVAAGRAALIARLHALAARVELLPFDTAAEVLVRQEPMVETLEQHAASPSSGLRWGPNERPRLGQCGGTCVVITIQTARRSGHDRDTTAAEVAQS